MTSRTQVQHREFLIVVVAKFYIPFFLRDIGELRNNVFRNFSFRLMYHVIDLA